MKESVHRKVEKLFEKQTEPVNEVDTEKDFKQVLHKIEGKLKKDFTSTKKETLRNFILQLK